MSGGVSLRKYLVRTITGSDTGTSLTMPMEDEMKQSTRELQLRSEVEKLRTYCKTLQDKNEAMQKESIRISEFIQAISPFLLRLSILDLDQLQDDLVPFKFQKEELRRLLEAWKESKNGRRTVYPEEMLSTTAHGWYMPQSSGSYINVRYLTASDTGSLTVSYSTSGTTDGSAVLFSKKDTQHEEYLRSRIRDLERDNRELMEENQQIAAFIKAISPFLLRLSILDLDQLEVPDGLVPFKFAKEELRTVLEMWKRSKRGRKDKVRTTYSPSYTPSPSPSPEDDDDD